MGERKHKDMNCSTVLGQMNTILGPWICTGTTASYLWPLLLQKQQSLLLTIYPIPNFSCFTLSCLSLIYSQCWLSQIIYTFFLPVFTGTLPRTLGLSDLFSTGFQSCYLSPCFKTCSFLVSICHGSVSGPLHCFRSLSLTRFS